MFLKVLSRAAVPHVAVSRVDFVFCACWRTACRMPHGVNRWMLLCTTPAASGAAWRKYACCRKTKARGRNPSPVETEHQARHLLLLPPPVCAPRFKDGVEICPAGSSCSCGVSHADGLERAENCLLYTSPSPRDRQKSRMPSSA